MQECCPNLFSIITVVVSWHHHVTIKIEPAHDKTNKMTCELSEDSGKPVHPPSLIRVFAVRLTGSEELIFLHADSEDSDQTWQMPRLI